MAGHGTVASYQHHGCRCQRCRAAWAANQRGFRLARRARLARADVQHGTQGAYVNWFCRCAACTAANSAQSRTAKRRRRQQKVAPQPEG